MTPTLPTVLLPNTTTDTFASSYGPSSPVTPTTRAMRRSRSPSRLYNGRSSSRGSTGFSRVSPRVKWMLTPRVLSPIILWAVGIYLVHNFLLPLPLPSLSRTPRESASTLFLSTSFPPPPNRLGDDTLDSVDPRYRPLHPLPPPDPPFPRLRPTRFLPPRCMEQWFAEGETTCGAAELGAEETLDATWLWVNGTDPRWREQLAIARKEARVYSPEHHFREQNELVYSMRSVLAALPGKVKTFHLLTADFPVRPEDQHLLPDVEDTSEWRIAQAPIWLDYSKRDPAAPDHPRHGEKYPQLRYAAHSEVFRLPTYDRDGQTLALGEHEWKEEQYRAKALPSFNSMSIESRIGWLPGLADVSLSLNDDFFLLKPHAVSDFHSPLYGSVYRFDPNYYNQVKPKLDPKFFNEAGENGGLYHANWLLSQRFPKRLRPYFAHVPKVITRGLHHEASLMFAEAITASSTRNFRELTTGHGDVQMQWLLSSLKVERWREALLWTYVVANLGAREYGFWADNARAELQDMFGLTPEDTDVIKIEVHKGERWTLEPGRMNKVFEQAGWEAPKASQFLFSSMDGHMPPIVKPGFPSNKGDKCVLDLERCFGSFWTKESNMTAADMFTRLSFQNPECGDCLITALVTASGPLGLSAFLPPKGTTQTNTADIPYPRYLPPPHLPLTSTWHEANFSLDSVLATTTLPNERVDLRQYAMKLLSRYQYLSGQSEHHFHMLTTPDHAVRVFNMINNHPRVSILGLNDDIVQGYDQIVAMMGAWFESKWPTKAAWER